MSIDLVSLIVLDDDRAIDFFTNALGFTLEEDSTSADGDGQAKRWVVVRPPDGGTGLLLSRANGDEQRALVGRQFARRVGLILRVEDFDAARTRMLNYGVEFVDGPRSETYGTVAVFVDVAGNRWDLIGPA